MTRSPDSLIPSGAGQPASEKRDDKAFNCRQEGEANLRAATQVNAVTASSTRPAITPIQLDLFPGRACALKAKPATTRNTARIEPSRRDGVLGGGTQRQTIELTGETLFGPAEETPRGREAYNLNPAVSDGSRGDKEWIGWARAEPVAKNEAQQEAPPLVGTELLRSLRNSLQELTYGLQCPANRLRLRMVAGDGQRGLVGVPGLPSDPLQQ